MSMESSTLTLRLGNVGDTMEVEERWGAAALIGPSTVEGVELLRLVTGLAMVVDDVKRDVRLPTLSIS